MTKEKTFEEVKQIEIKNFNDNRGYFSETYNKDFLLKHGIKDDFIQDNESFSLKLNTLRGLHFQLPPYEQSKLIRVIKGSILDVFIDLRRSSEMYENFGSIKLTKESGLLYIPAGFAHGFLTLSDETLISYKVNNHYNKEAELGIRWNDPFFAINWPSNSKEIILSEKDNNLPLWDNIKDKANF
ncbi:MAG: dTDP-4-dehydrorhamnose 3,5-epimerase [Euryarchaeota archaeon]|nr:dTDP-4-dehydrorhamnose 3,5-epimerase [Euryarchaeota archaeon]